ncbi:hypothetical protein GCM10010399_43580 [Dactylosporangium fulvum]|uniref:DUF4232 domain-containing protein n=1 Tax=Dactylosporangium fulvum TaxID=53359 RepID=A0ABY5W913_9ACTN|nr:DUF4232 domain-containing protein [Dactylosporangium fulvum]UWP85974.1 DUF4232 domain-containing protein [Dactylosporangium fulvum]
MQYRPRLLAAATAALVILASTAACSSKKDEPTAAPATGPSAPSGTTPTEQNSGDQTAACATADVKPRLIGQAQRSSGTTRVVMLQLTNTSSRTCRLSGWATVTLTDAADAPVPVPTSKLEQPGPATPVDLAPGATASAGVKWTTCDKAATGCATGNSVSVGLPDGRPVPAELLEFPPAEASAITMKSMQIGTIQPSAQGVVAW